MGIGASVDAGQHGPSSWSIVRRSKLIHLSYGTRREIVEIPNGTTGDEIKDMLLALFNARPQSTVTLRNDNGIAVPITARLRANSTSAPYHVDIKDAQDSRSTGSGSGAVAEPTAHLAEEFQKAFRFKEFQEDIVGRIGRLEGKIEEHSARETDLSLLRRELNEMRDRFALTETEGDHSGRRVNMIAEPPRRRSLSMEVPTFPKYVFTEETREYLKHPTFNIWQWEANEMLNLLELMLVDLGLVSEFKINPLTLKHWLVRVKQNYKNNPFHNFRHCFCVAQMMYGMIYLCELQNKLSKLEQLILMVSAICHDLDHPGQNNAYQINARTELAIRYNDISPLENHHCSVAFQIVSEAESNIFANVDNETFKQIRQGMIALILATDMVKHGDFVKDFQRIHKAIDYTNAEHKKLLMQVLLKCCDISNEARPMKVSEPWLDCLLEEYFAQSDLEKKCGLPVAPFMDRDKVTKPTAQIGFIKYVLIPLFEAVSVPFPQVEPVLLDQLRRAHDHYVKMKEIDDAVKARSESPAVK